MVPSYDQKSKIFHDGTPMAEIYDAHIEIVVTFLVVNFLGCLVIARYPTMRF